MRTIHKTKNGTELPILNLRGKEYLEVKYRLVWFREDHPDWSIETEIISRDKDSACVKSTIRNETGRVIATAHKFENVQGFGDFIEKAETGSTGRALALIGYGTQFCADEFDEGERIVDSPIDPKKSQAQTNVAGINELLLDAAKTANEKYIKDNPKASDSSTYIMTHGAPGVKGVALGLLNKSQLEGFLDYFKPNGKPHTGTLLKTYCVAHAWYKEKFYTDPAFNTEEKLPF